MMTEPVSYGTLYIVATPLGNLDDITFRAIDTLKSVDIIAAEDTRHSKKLLNHYNISTRLVSCHEHNEEQKAQWFISKLKAGNNIALISDAGTPCISDPGFMLVRNAAEEKIPVIPIPGCSAAIAGLSVSGLATDRFLFLGFLPKKKMQRHKALMNIKDQVATLVIYESPKRILKLIEDSISVLGDRHACLAREITKMHEEFIRGRLSKLLEKLNSKDRIRGEVALYIEGSSGPGTLSENEILEIIKARLKDHTIGTSSLATAIATEFNLSKKKIYDSILKIQNSK